MKSDKALFIKCLTLTLMSASMALLADYGETNEIKVTEVEAWRLPEDFMLSERINARTPVFMRNKSYVNLKVSYIYNGKPVSQVIPSGTSIPLGLQGKINFTKYPPLVYRYSDIGARIRGEMYKKSHMVPPTVYGQQYGATCGTTVLELSVSLSAIFDDAIDIRVGMLPAYNFMKRDISHIFPNLSQGYLSYIGLGSSLATLAKNPTEARHILDLPRTFAENRTRQNAEDVVKTALATKLDALETGQWVASGSYEQEVKNALGTAAQTLLIYLRAQGDLSNVVEW